MPGRLSSRRTVLWLMCGCCAGCSFAVAPLMNEFGPREGGAILVYICLGVIAAELTLVSIYLVFAHEPTWRRASISYGAAVVLFICWALGVAVSMRTTGSGFREAKAGLVGALCLPLMLLAVQLPLWLARIFLGWRVVSQEPTASAAPLNVLSIRDILAGMASIGAALAAAQYAGQVAVGDGTSVGRFWAQIMAFAASITATSLFAGLPLMIAGLRILGLATAIAAIVVYAAIVEAVTLALLSWWTVTPFDAWELTGLSIMVAAFVATTFLPLRALHHEGYQLSSRRHPIHEPWPLGNVELDLELPQP